MEIILLRISFHRPLFSLGMRHDAKEISCDPTMHIMSPKLGSGKVTWSKCSRTYLEDFLMYVASLVSLNHTSY